MEGGGQWVGPGQARILELAESLGVGTFPSHHKGKVVVSYSGFRFTRPGDEGDSADFKRVTHMLESLAKTVPPKAPWLAEHAQVWDDQTVSEWLDKNTRDDETKQTFELNISTELGPPSKISLLYYLFFIRHFCRQRSRP